MNLVIHFYDEQENEILAYAIVENTNVPQWKHMFETEQSRDERICDFKVFYEYDYEYVRY